jgi:hypothetical protein
VRRAIRLPQRAVLPGAAAVVFVVACLVVRGGLLRAERFGDVGLYSLDAQRVLDGHVPYRDFFFEYPPGTLPAVLAPALVSMAHYTFLFKALMTLLGAATLLVASRVAAVVGMPTRRAAAALGAMAVAPLLLGPLVLDEYDLWPTLLTVAAILAVLRGRDGIGAALLGFGAATKIFPAAILPLALVWIYRRAGRRACVRALVVALGVAVATYIAFVAIAPGGVWYSTLVQLRRGLQKESLGSSVLFALDQLGFYKARIAEGNPHWTELTGPAGDTLAMLSSLCQVAAAAAAAAIVARRRPEPRTLLYGASVAVAGFVAFGKVFSPQYLIWLVPFVALAGGVLAGAMLGSALVLTQLWFLRIVTPFDLDAGIWLVVLRDLLVVGVFVSLLIRLKRLDLAAPSRGRRTTLREADSGRAAPT